VPLALEADSQGRPKKPIIPGWQNIGEDWELQPWGTCKGLGILLGPASGNLAVLDVDDEDLSNAILRLSGQDYTVQTIRKRLHIYLYETEPSAPSMMRVDWNGKFVSVELRTKGQQVAAPPTPGYVRLNREQPRVVRSIGDYWGQIALSLKVGSSVSEKYPKPWRTVVVEGERNKAMFIEAIRLAEAHVPLPAALEMLQARYDNHYNQGEDDWAEYEKTIKSAYRRGNGIQHRGNIDRLSRNDSGSGRAGEVLVRRSRAEPKPRDRSGREYMGGDTRPAG
jgi:hypothetical protein